MSTLQFLREKAGVLVAVVIGLSLFIFVVSDFFGSGSGQRRQMRKYYQIGEIAGEEILYQDYEERVQSLMEIYKLSGTATIDEATAESIREQTWQQMVREKILDSQYKKLGIGVSTEEVDDLVLGNNPHPVVLQLFTDQNTGMFNKSFLVNFLKQTEVDETAKRYWLFFENEIVNDRMNTKYNSFVSKGLYVTSRQAEFDMNLASVTADFSYIMKSYADVPDTAITITAKDIEAYYAKHKNNYKRSALRDIEYVSFDVIPSEDDIRVAEEWINKIKEEFAVAEDPVQFINLNADTRHIGFFMPISEVPAELTDFVRNEDLKEVFGPYEDEGSFKVAKLLAVAERPDSVRARHILLAPDQTQTLEDVRSEADSLIKLIRSGVSFEVLAMSNSVDQGSAQLGGDLGWFPEGRMVVPFNNACFSNRKGSLVTAETNFGIHIIEILDQSGRSKKYDIGIIDRKIIAGSLTNQKVYSEASQFAGSNNTYEKFNKSINEMGLNKRIANDVSPMQKSLPGLDNPRSLIISLFQAAEGKIILDNSQQAVFEIGDQYVIAYCTRVQEEGIAPLKDVENDIRFNLVRDKKAEVVSTQFRASMGAGGTIDDVARSMGLVVQEATQVNFRSFSVAGAGNEPALIGAGSVARPGILAGPVKGNNGVYMLTVNSQTTSDSEDLSMLRDRLLLTFQMRGNYEAYEALRRGANIVDRRYRFY